MQSHMIKVGELNLKTDLAFFCYKRDGFVTKRDGFVTYFF